jgi:hypothetical protein
MYALTKSAVLFCAGVIVQSREIQGGIHIPVLGIAVFWWSSNYHSSVMLKKFGNECYRNGGNKKKRLF